MKKIKNFILYVPLIFSLGINGSINAFAGKTGQRESCKGGNGAEVPLKDVIESIQNITLTLGRPDVIDEGFGFKVNPVALKGGDGQLGVTIQDISSFKKDYPELADLDFEGLLSDKKGGNYVWATQNAYIIDVDPQFFGEEIMNDPVFQKKTNDAKSVEKTNEPNVLKFTTEVNFGPLKRPDAVAEIEGHNFDLSKGTGDISPERLQAIISTNPELGAKPEKVNFSFTRHTSDKGAVGSNSVTKYYRIDGNKTLLVSYWMLVLKLGWTEKAGIGMAKPFIKKFAPEGTSKNIQALRKTINEYKEAK